MAKTSTSSTGEPNREPRRVLLWISIIAGCVAVFGHLMGTRIGGFGPSLFWSGLTAGLVASGCYAILKRLPDAHVQSLAPLFAAVTTMLQATTIALVMLESVAWYGAVPTDESWERSDMLNRWHRPHQQLKKPGIAGAHIQRAEFQAKDGALADPQDGVVRKGENDPAFAVYPDLLA